MRVTLSPGFRDSKRTSWPGPERVDYVKWTPPVLSQDRFQGIPFHRSAVDGVYGCTEEFVARSTHFLD